MLTIVQRYSLYICSRFYSPCLVTHPNYRTNFEATKVLYLQKKKWLSWYLTGCYLTHKAINKKETKQCTYWIQNKISQTKWYMTAISFDPPFGHTFDHEIIFISPLPLKKRNNLLWLPPNELIFLSGVERSMVRPLIRMCHSRNIQRLNWSVSGNLSPRSRLK